MTTYDLTIRATVDANTREEAELAYEEGDYTIHDHELELELERAPIACALCEREMIRAVLNNSFGEEVWNCITENCDYFSGDEVTIDDLQAIGVPAHLASRILSYINWGI